MSAGDAAEEGCGKLESSPATRKVFEWNKAQIPDAHSGGGPLPQGKQTHTPPAGMMHPPQKVRRTTINLKHPFGGIETRLSFKWGKGGSEKGVLGHRKQCGQRALSLFHQLLSDHGHRQNHRLCLQVLSRSKCRGSHNTQGIKRGGQPARQKFCTHCPLGSIRTWPEPSWPTPIRQMSP
eukprot:EG_transcript_27058